MRDLDKALADILAIRSQLAAGTAFRGYGPAAMVVTAGMAGVTMVLQLLLLKDPTSQPLMFFLGWLVTALTAVIIISIEMQARTRRHHLGLADAMIYQAVEQALPAGVAGVLIAALLWQLAPESLWMLPGLWQLLASLGIFASARSLPGSIRLGGAWYFVTGFVCLMLASQTHTLSPWAMGLPFLIGQSLMAAILHLASGEADDGED